MVCLILDIKADYFSGIAIYGIGFPRLLSGDGHSKNAY